MISFSGWSLDCAQWFLDRFQNCISYTLCKMSRASINCWGLQRINCRPSIWMCRYRPLWISHFMTDLLEGSTYSRCETNNNTRSNEEELEGLGIVSGYGWSRGGYNFLLEKVDKLSRWLGLKLFLGIGERAILFAQ